MISVDTRVDIPASFFVFCLLLIGVLNSSNYILSFLYIDCLCSFCWDQMQQCLVWHIQGYLHQQCHKLHLLVQAVDDTCVNCELTDKLDCCCKYHFSHSE